jgi:hypothetical protein
MAIVDAQLVLADGQAIATSTSETITTNVIDLTSASFDPGEGRPAYLHIMVEEAVTHASALTVTFKFYSHSAVGVTSGTAHITTPAIAKADLVAGYELVYPLPLDMDRYIGCSHTCSATTATGGAFSMWVDLG